MLETAELIAEGLPDRPGREAAWRLLALLAGGVMLSRAVIDPDVADEIARAVRSAVDDGRERRANP